MTDQNIFENATIIVSNPTSRNYATVIASYMRAVERFRDACHQSNSNDEQQVHYREIGYSSLLESVAWSRNLIEGIDIGKRNFPNQDYALALYFARNQLIHSLDELIDISLQKNQVSRWLWSSKNQSKYQLESGYSSYQKILMKKEIISTLDEFTEIIWKFRKHKITKANLEQPGVPVLTPISLDSE